MPVPIVWKTCLPKAQRNTVQELCLLVRKAHLPVGDYEESVWSEEEIKYTFKKDLCRLSVIE